MEKRVYDINLMKFISLFESLTGARVKDCVEQDQALLFVIEPGDMGKAIGRNGSHIKRIEGTIKKPIRVVEFSDNIEEFVCSLLYPLVPLGVNQEEGTLVITGKDAKTRGMIIGRDRSRLHSIQSIIARFFPIKEIKVT